MKVKFEWKNLEEVMFRINLMTNKEAKATFRAGVAEGAKVVKKYAQSGAPGSGIGYKTLRGGPEFGTALVGPFSKNWWYDMFEWGTKLHGPKKKGKAGWTGVLALRKSGEKIFARKVRGIAAKPFMRRAFESHVDEVYNAIVAGYKKMIEKLGV